MNDEKKQKNYAQAFNEAARKILKKEKKESRSERIESIKRVLKNINQSDL